MPRKCCVGGCRSMYDGTVEKVIVFGFPTEEDECRKWTNALPNIIHNVTKTTGVCEKHWPPGYERIRKKGFDRPKHPPSVFHGIPATFLPQTLVSSRVKQKNERWILIPEIQLQKEQKLMLTR